MKAGTIVTMADGRVGTVVYNGLDGVGVKWGRYDITARDLRGSGGLCNDDALADYEWCPDAILREPWNGCERMGWSVEQCVGTDYTTEDEGHGA